MYTLIYKEWLTSTCKTCRNSLILHVHVINGLLNETYWGVSSSSFINLCWKAFYLHESTSLTNLAFNVIGNINPIWLYIWQIHHKISLLLDNTLYVFNITVSDCVHIYCNTSLLHAIVSASLKALWPSVSNMTPFLLFINWTNHYVTYARNARPYPLLV